MDDQHASSELEASQAPVLSQHERAMVAAAEASVERVGTIPWHEARAWLRSLGTSAELTTPLPRK